MIRSIWNSRSGMSAEMDKLDAISNNMSNVNTTGYKRVDVKFQDLMKETLKKTGYPVTSNGKAPFTGSGVKSTEFQRDNSQGSLIQTGSNTDFAIDGMGFFKVIDSNNKESYVRGGAFNIDKDGTVVDDKGNKLVILDESGRNVNNGDNIRFKKDDLQVSEDGSLRSSMYKGFRIPLYDVVGDNSMKSIGENLYKPENGSIVNETKNADIIQGFVEHSNVDLGREMTELIVTQRAFQLNSTALKTADEMWGMANNLRGR